MFAQEECKEMYVSEYLHSDVKAYEVIEKKTPNEWIVRELNAQLTEESSKKLHDSFVPGGFCGHFDNSVQKWEFSSNPDNPLVTIRRHKDGNFYMSRSHACPFIPKDKPYKYYDYNF